MHSQLYALIDGYFDVSVCQCVDLISKKAILDVIPIFRATSFICVRICLILAINCILLRGRIDCGEDDDKNRVTCSTQLSDTLLTVSCFFVVYLYVEISGVLGTNLHYHLFRYIYLFKRNKSLSCIVFQYVLMFDVRVSAEMLHRPSNLRCSCSHWFSIGFMSGDQIHSITKEITSPCFESLLKNLCKWNVLINNWQHV